MCIFSIFFSSRRLHTRWPRDWSSDVCSFDLRAWWYPRSLRCSLLRITDSILVSGNTPLDPERRLVVAVGVALLGSTGSEIGRASCRERVLILVVGGEGMHKRRCSSE